MGSVGRCSCSQTEGMAVPIEATAVQSSTLHGRVNSQPGDSSVHRRQRNTVSTATLLTAKATTSSVVAAAVPDSNRNKPCTTHMATHWTATKISV